MQKQTGWLSCLAVLACLAGAGTQAETQQHVDVEALVEQVQGLVEANEALAKRVAELEKRLAEREAVPGQEEVEVVAEAAQAPEAPEQGGTPLGVYWDEGLRFEPQDDAFSLKIGGRVHFDAAFFDGPEYWSLGGAAIDEHDGAEVRQLRLTMAGDLYEDYHYELEVEFAGDDADVLDAYVGVKDVPVVGAIWAGQFAEPLGLEALTNANFTTFMERSMATQALIPFRSRGLQVSNRFLEERLTVAAGVFHGGEDEDSHWNYTARITGLPWYAADGRRLLHLGAAYSHRNPESEYGFAARPASHLANKHWDTGDLPVDDLDLWGLEAALVLGPFSLQGEFLRADASFVPEPRDLTFFDLDRFFQLDDRHFSGYYVEASYFLTGEHRVYDRTYGCFTRVVPRNKLRIRGRGWGAWQVAVRYEKLDLDDFDVRSGVIGGQGHNLTVGLNWYTTAHTRLMLNYIKSHVDQFAYDGTIDVFQARFQVDF